MKADLFALGCIFAEITACSAGKSTPAFYRIPRKKSSALPTFGNVFDRSFEGNMPAVKKFLHEAMAGCKEGEEPEKILHAMWTYNQGLRPTLRTVMEGFDSIRREHYASVKFCCAILTSPPKTPHIKSILQTGIEKS